jgi:ribosomal protein L13E
MDEDRYKEGVDFEWRKSPNSNIKSRHFFTKAEKAERAKPKAEAAPKVTPKPAPKAAPKAAPTARPKARQQGRGDGVAEVKQRKVDTTKATALSGASRSTQGKDKPRAMTTAPVQPKAPQVRGATRKTEPAKPKTEVTYSEWQNMSRAERQKAGLPVSVIGGQLGFKRFRSGITGKDYTMNRK